MLFLSSFVFQLSSHSAPVSLSFTSPVPLSMRLPLEVRIALFPCASCSVVFQSPSGSSRQLLMLPVSFRIFLQTLLSRLLLSPLNTMSLTLFSHRPDLLPSPTGSHLRDLPMRASRMSGLLGMLQYFGYPFFFGVAAWRCTDGSQDDVRCDSGQSRLGALRHSARFLSTSEIGVPSLRG